jgi:hypothetical protein
LGGEEITKKMKAEDTAGHGSFFFLTASILDGLNKDENTNIYSKSSGQHKVSKDMVSRLD